MINDCRLYKTVRIEGTNTDVVIYNKMVTKIKINTSPGWSMIKFYLIEGKVTEKVATHSPLLAFALFTPIILFIAE